MKTKLTLLSLTFLSLYFNIHSMDSEILNSPEMLQKAMEGIVRIGTDISNDIELRIQRIAQDNTYKKEILINRIKNSTDEKEKTLLQKEYNAILEEEKKSKERWGNASNQFMETTNHTIKMGADYFKDKLTQEMQLEKIAITETTKGREKSKGALDRHKETLKLLKDPQVVKSYAVAAGAALSAVAFSVYASKHGLELAKNLFWDYYKNPTIAQETSLLTFKEKLSNKIFGQKALSKEIKDVILEPELENRINLLAQSIKNTVKNGAYFQNILLYGPPGTGKTMVSQRIARSCGLDYIYFAASSLLQLSEEEALKKITELFEFAKNSPKKLMIIIDEAEKLFAHRKRQVNDKTRNILTQMLTYTGTESRDYMIVALTNIPDEIDPAFLNRCDEQINITPPNLTERVKIIEKYVNDYLLSSIGLNITYNTKLSKFIKLFKKAKPEVKLNIKDNCINQNKILEIAKQTEGFVGRDISKMVLSMQAQAFATNDKTLTEQIINKTVKDKIEQKKRSLEGFKHKYAGLE